MRAWSILLSLQKMATRIANRGIAADERVIFFPTNAVQVNETHWTVPIHGWIFEPEEDSRKRKAFLSLFRRMLKVPSNSTEDLILKHRIRAFLVDNERSKTPVITLAGQEYRMMPSGKNGHFRTNLTIADSQLRENNEEDTYKDRYVKFHAVSDNKEVQYTGMVHLVPPNGVTIVSDIDDTIKITNVVNKRAMLRNTFMKEFEPVPGMAEVYQKWAKEWENCRLHLLSSSPYQLYEELDLLRQRAGFPLATYTLKLIRPKSAVQALRIMLEDPQEFKRNALVKLFQDYPSRKFILVGDTGERDPDVYAAVARMYPHQVLGIFLRHVPRDEVDDVPARVQMSMGGVAPGTWMIFQHASELDEIVIIHRSQESR